MACAERGNQLRERTIEFFIACYQVVVLLPTHWLHNVYNLVVELYFINYYLVLEHILAALRSPNQSS